MQFILSMRDLKKTRKRLFLALKNWFEKIKEQNAQKSQFDRTLDLNAIYLMQGRFEKGYQKDTLWTSFKESTIKNSPWNSNI